ncbi:MAG: malto-oligosyltrehalose synthase [Proteobacteria bacterium]|nr:malto-oligosyltrehalose synthase [Pseudomonadota bacterium]MBU1687099.1 malto-oligosyltrehalose synthase [Pseudomonadota bacterium]
MQNIEIIDRLAILYGIEESYHDIHGKQHRIAPATKRALLVAMGVDTTNAETLAAALAAEERRPWQRLLDSVLVLRSPLSALPLSLHLSQSHCNSRFAWELREETGRTWQGEFLTESLHCTAKMVIDGALVERCELTIDVVLAEGYHQLTLHELDCDDPLSGDQTLIVAPPSCYVPAGLHEEGRVWGPAIQLYGVRSRRNWGIGDFTDLDRIFEYFAERGAGIIGINPINALFGHNPRHKSPYSPSSRLFFNPLYLDIEALADFQESHQAREAVQDPQFQVGLANLREAELVNHAGVAAAKRAILEIVYQHFRDHHLNSNDDRGRAFRGFQEKGGEPLWLYGLFEALQERFYGDDPSVWGWPVWPEPFRHPAAAAVRRFAEEQQTRLEFFLYLQWQASLQLGAVGRRSFELGLNVGLYADLPVSVDAAGAETWIYQEIYAQTARIGAPPDDFNLRGQDWGLPPMIPSRLRESAYGPFIATLRANMRHAGALRLDHVMGLNRLFWVPSGKNPTEGAYVRYPFEELTAILALESQRNKCLVVGEDLGTVPDEIRDGLLPQKVLSCRLLYFEKNEAGEFQSPADYPAQAMVAATTHDLPTLAGYWQGRDLALRTELGLFPDPDQRNSQIIARAADRSRLLLLLAHHGLLPEGAGLDPAAYPRMRPELALAVHAFLARTSSKLFLFQMEDVLGQTEQINLPGTVDEYPNWQRKLVLDLEEWPNTEQITLHVEAIRRQRDRGVTPPGRGTTWMPGEAGSRIPSATYRFQFNRDFTFAMATELVPYLHGLGISHCYASPFLKARPGSLHGYDIIDHNLLNPEIGDNNDFNRFTETLGAHSMKLILDMVPNHIGVGSDNQWWMDVLENGESSNFADFFDIDWQPIKEALRGKVLLPILEDHYGSVLEKGLLALRFDGDGGEFFLDYHEQHLPIDPASYPLILGHDIERLEARFHPDAPFPLDLRSLVTAFDNLPSHRTTVPEERKIRLRDKEVHKRHLAHLCKENIEIDRFIAENTLLFNGTMGEASSYQLLHGLLERQAYRLANWRVAADEINYRRFFDINDLAALRMENRRVFEKTHHFVLDLIAAEKIAGLRIDHPDGLYDPGQYYQWLNEAARSRSIYQTGSGCVAVSDGEAKAPVGIYLVVEKILAVHERLRPNWPVHGTTGYEFANLVGGLFVESRFEKEMTAIYTRFIGKRIVFDELLYTCKKHIIRGSLASEFTVLANELRRIAEGDWNSRDFTLNNIRDALMEIVACFPVYRTYVTAAGIDAEDRRYVKWATAQSQKRSMAADTSIFAFIGEVLLDACEGREGDASHRKILAFAMKFQQYTAPVMAKGLEDTSCYIYNRLLALNEVGGDPRRFGTSVATFHRANQERAEQWPHAMLGTSTHDSKRSEDVRARLAVLSEIPTIWSQQVRRWSMLNRTSKRRLYKAGAPSKNDEYGLYQILLGVWPLEDLDEAGLENFADRIRQYAIKAVREAKVHSSWININEDYEKATIDFIGSLLRPGGNNRFLVDFLPFKRQVARYGLFNSLAQLLLRLTVPGVPDIYQGDELWRFELVDPDNRRPVDYTSRRLLLQETTDRFADAKGNRLEEAVRLPATLEDGRTKFFVIQQTLAFRNLHQTLFREGHYVPLVATGERADHLVAFARVNGEESCLVVVPRLMAQLIGFHAEILPIGEIWGDTTLALPGSMSAKRFRNVFTAELINVEEGATGPELPVGNLLAHFPVALFAAMDL